MRMKLTDEWKITQKKPNDSRNYYFFKSFHSIGSSWPKSNWHKLVVRLKHRRILLYIASFHFHCVYRPFDECRSKQRINFIKCIHTPLTIRKGSPFVWSALWPGARRKSILRSNNIISQRTEQIFSFASDILRWAKNRQISVETTEVWAESER